MTRAIVGIAVFATILSAAGLAAAETQGPADITKDTEGLFYKFGDADDLTAIGNGANGAMIRVMNPVVRRTLIRPRASFVPEMLKSVEQI